jgi:hypothetical protein
MTEAPSFSSNASPEEIRAQAEQFMELLTALRADGSEDAKNMREALVTIVAEFRDTPDRERAKVELMSRLMGVESGIADLMGRTVGKIRDRLVKESKRIGAASQQGKVIRTTTDALGTVLDALQQLVDANAENDGALRDSAHALLAKAKTKLEAVGMR